MYVKRLIGEFLNFVLLLAESTNSIKVIEITNEQNFVVDQVLRLRLPPGGKLGIVIDIDIILL